MKHLTCLLLLFIMAGCNTTPANLGADDGRLADCPWAPRCVSSQASDPDDRVAPIRYSGSLAEARQTLLDVLQGMDDMRIVKVEERYLHAKVRSDWFNFVDDLEFLFVPAAQLIHVRSSARVGLYDFDVNRDRINTLRSRFLTAQ